MSGKSLPKPSSKTALNKKYQLLAIETMGRLDTATENGRANINLLQKYYNAFPICMALLSLTMHGIYLKYLKRKKSQKSRS